ncbi:uncharacterized protein LOC143143216 isoform X1 [Ptiloglossa arizonensis]|uniref:uncharacterized protein LOC143143216 isoform X1 n=1 Tax=Ptiloglossa arizonensis TaxID=3350558 RepID=UPI003FA11636
MSEVSERRGPERRRRRAVAFGDPSQDLVPKQKNQMEASESAAIGAAPASGDGGEGTAGTRRGSSSRQHRRLLSTLQRSDPDPKSSASTAATSGTVFGLDGRFPLHRGRPVPERDLCSRMPALTRPIAAVPGPYPPPGRRRRHSSSLGRILEPKRRKNGVDDPSTRTTTAPDHRDRESVLFETVPGPLHRIHRRRTVVVRDVLVQRVENRHDTVKCASRETTQTDSD